MDGIKKLTEEVQPTCIPQFGYLHELQTASLYNYSEWLNHVMHYYACGL